MTVPNNSEFLRVMKLMNGMVKELDAAIKPAKPIFQAAKDSTGFSRNLTSVAKRAKFIEGEHTFWKGSAQRALKAKDAVKLRETLETTQKTTKSVKDTITNFGKGLFKGKNNPTASQWSNMGGLLAITAFLTYKTFVDEEINDINQANQDKLNSDLTRAYSNISRAVLLSRKNTHDIEKLKDEVNKNNAEITAQNRKIAEARKLGNDGLAEARSYNKSLQQRITEFINSSRAEIQKAYKLGNDGLAESRSYNRTLSQKISDQNLKIVQQGTNHNNQINQLNTTYKNQINQLKQQFQQLASTVSKGASDSIATTINTLKQGVAEAKAEARASKDFATTVQKTLEIARGIAEVSKQIATTAATKADSALTESVKNGAAIKLVDGKIEVVANNAVKNWASKVWEPTIYQSKAVEATLAQGITNIASDVSKFKEEARNKIGFSEVKIESIDNKVNTIDNKINTTTKEVEKTKQDIKEANNDLKKIGTKITDIEKMDKQANEKLEKLIPAVAMLPPLIRNVGNDLKTNMPTIPQIEAAAATGTCRTTQPGGCSRKMMEDVIGSNANNINANTNDKFGQLNAALNGADLALLGVINRKLGDQVDGGLSGFLKRVSQNAIIDRLLNLMVFATTLHNALMLSNNLGQTLIGIVNNILGFFGVKDGEGKNIDLGVIIGQSVESFIKSLIGAEAYVKLTQDLAKANRIYQATANLLNQVQSLHNSVLSALEVGFGWTAKIGNALKKWGAIGEQAYQWMNPQPNFKWKVFQYLETAQQGASTVETIVASVVDVKEQVTQLAATKTELEQALGTEEKKETATKAPEAQKVKEEQTASKLVSATGIAISDEHKEADE